MRRAQFHQVIYLGRIAEAGSYALFDRTTKSKLGTLKVEEAPQSSFGTDSQQYAPLTDAFLTPKGSAFSLTLRGIASPECGTYKDAEFLVQQNVLVVLPKFEMKEGPCRGRPEAFERKVSVSVKLPPSPFLLHVRSVGGQAIHKMNY